MATAVVFAYHDVGVRCLSVLLAHGLEIELVVTHRDDPKENIWFASVENLARIHGLPSATPDQPSEVEQRVAALKPDFVFSFYYRHMLKAPLLEAVPRGAYNLHGSLLPRYRGRVPINWAIIHGETETGATLHVMNVKPDNGAIVDQCAVPILIDDTAGEVFGKVVVAAEIVLARSLPKLIDGTASFTPQVLSDGGYFGGRKPEDGRIPADAGAKAVHDLVRALAPPYPGAFIDLHGRRIVIERTRLVDAPPSALPGQPLRLAADGDALQFFCADGCSLQVLAATMGGQPLTAARLRALTTDH